MNTFFLCSLLTAAFLGILYIWGKTFLVAIHGKSCVCDSILFGFVLIHVVFQVFYLPFLLTRGSFYSLCKVWIAAAALITAGMMIYLWKMRRAKFGQAAEALQPGKGNKAPQKWKAVDIILLLAATAVCAFLCWDIGSRPRHNGTDTFQYIDHMNKMVYRGTLWIESTGLEIHQGMNSFYTLFAVLSWMTGIKPLYINSFTMRFLGVIFGSLMSYHFSQVAFEKEGRTWSLVVAVLAPLAMMIWSSFYGTGRFFFERTNESKAFCQILLFPLSVSILAQMFQENHDRRILWKEQFLVGLSAVPMAVSSLSIYPVILFAGMVGLLAYDRMKGTIRTILLSALCAMPNVLYMVFYVLYQKQILRF